jgi:DNA-nicking Smr family endonuclease
MWPFHRKKRMTPGKQGPDREPAAEPFVVTDTLDLHGFFPEQVPPMIADFIENARELGLGRLRIVHGKGKSRLKWEVHQILKGHPEVSSYRDAPPDAGGWGATIVLLRDIGKGQ